MKRLSLNVTVLGGGAFGTAIATAAARAGHMVKMWSKIDDNTINDINKTKRNKQFFTDEIVIPDNVYATNNLEESLEKTNMVFHVIPVQVSYDFIKENAALFPEDVPYIVASKGILLKQKKFISQVWKTDLFPKKNVPHCMLSGPSFAIEMMQNYPTVIALACKDKRVAKFIHDNFWHETFKTEITDDVIGVECGGALKNPLALASGVFEGSGYKFNTASALIHRGLAEMSIFAENFGGRSETIYGLSGIGDLVLCCLGGENSRNKSFGKSLAKGKSMKEILQSATGVVEGVPTAFALEDLIKQHNLNMPLFSTIDKMIKGEITITEIQNVLLKFKDVEKEIRI
jgi:glycerol-3-phosphate dehydrogenase